MDKKKNKKVAVGGTFDILHKGHEALLKRAFSLGDLTIGLTADKMAQRRKKRKVHPFPLRKKTLEDFIKRKFNQKVKIVKIKDPFGSTLKEDFDFLVVSPETYPQALLINQERKKLGKKPIKIVKINFVLAKDKKPISATRIIRGEIDKEGNLIK